MSNVSPTNAVVSLDRYRLAVTRNRESARRAGAEDFSGSQLDAAIMREIHAQR
ncbi:MAG: hypothetical protein IPI32_11205 [Austwickia sp.]|jgi:hypothetical protein|nr:hypothetical protein [Austwickia sp.]MBK8435951.1 hypothetical protein [Austwickia sp.]MBK9101635.1 hypothetical protein [Austwickia sp.]